MSRLRCLAFPRLRARAKRCCAVLGLENLENRALPAAIVAVNDSPTVEPGVATIIDVIANDSNPDGTGLELISKTALTPAGPSLVNNGDGTFTFQSASTGNFSFDYTVTGAEHKLVAGDGAADDDFGFSVSAYGDTVAIGARSNDEAGTNAGSVYVFVRSGATWIQQAKLTASDAIANGAFGVSVSLGGDTLVVGAFGNGDIGGYSGAAYVFVRSGTTWSQQQRLTASDAVAGQQFGASVSVSGDTAVIGARGGFGSAYVFVRSGETWSEQAKLTGSDSAESDGFAGSVSVSGDTVVVGASSDGDGGINSGSTYVFERTGTTWSEHSKLVAFDAAAGDFFGTSVSVSGDTVVVGAGLDDDKGNGSGSAYVFVRDSTSWSLQAKLTANDGATGDQFGLAVSLSGDTLVLGAYGNNDDGSDSGSAYVFVRTGTTWSQRQKLLASDGAADDRFGYSVAVNEDTVVVGAFPRSVAGAAYVRNISKDTATVEITVADTVAPGAPSITSPSVPTFVDATSFAIQGTVEANSLVQIYRDVDNDGTINVGIDTVVASQQLTLGAISFSISVPLNQDVANNFLVTARDAAGNKSAPGDVPTITEVSGDHFETSTWVDYSTNSGWSPQYVGDFNGDGKDDVANFLASNGGWYISLSTGTSFLQPLRWVDLANSGFAQHLVGDFNGDGKDDIASFFSSTGVWYVGISTGTSFTSKGWIDLANSGWTSQQVGDFNGDGKDDIASLYKDGRWYVSISTGTSFTNSSWSNIGTGWARLLVGDFNGDGKDDVAGLKSGTGNWFVSLSFGTSFGSSTLWTTASSSWITQLVGDFNNDGKDDIAALFSSDLRWHVSLSNGAAFTTTAWGPTVGVTGWTNHEVADFTGDGVDDIAGFRNGDGTWRVSVSNGASSFTTTIWSNLTDGGWSRSTAGNFNGDAYADVANFRSSTGTWHVGLGRLPVSALALDGTAIAPAADAGSLTQAQLDTAVARAFSIFANLGVDTRGLGSLSFVIADIAGNTLGLAGTNIIIIDVNAAGYGWSLGDALDADDVDLLSVVLHELGHELGLEHGDAGFMAELIGLGERRLPTKAELDDALSILN